MCLRSTNNTTALCDIDGDCIEGCAKGFSGNKCDVNVPVPDGNDNKTHQPAAIEGDTTRNQPVAIIAGTAGGGVGLIIFIVVIVVVLKRRIPQDRGSPRNVYENSAFDGIPSLDTARTGGLEASTSDYSDLNDNMRSQIYSSLATNAAGTLPDTSPTYTYLDANAMGVKSDESSVYTSLATNAN
ncbi:uncharacterized protein LOC127858922 isoform X1 [Dreissena polymorpha]|uniref:uncharacterized protein LOC127858922 isoform X1 n=1 Tax=Dreissena polymorpha TaxID=45954 RepID=UPI002264F618|nr:uncharacterized protein LOC127858922 isoform X1 [Dreissena polymorpha]XP_052252221.1 uncharacterized protein LOC127858922 isoform X1 [Dreissena polymorpha]XP_052252222.1 uncharacterized protein LOC127858922 isoform X1 [Dreissena polymorpha]